VFTPLATRPAQPRYSPLDPSGVLALFLLPGLVQRRHPQPLITQRLDHEPADDPLRLVMIPHGVVEQPLHPVRCGVTGVLGQGPPILVRQVTHEPDHVLAGLLERLHPREA
jgi:hypothetical protein